jgi:hypothetical protein
MAISLKFTTVAQGYDSSGREIKDFLGVLFEDASGNRFQMAGMHLDEANPDSYISRADGYIVGRNDRGKYTIPKDELEKARTALVLAQIGAAPIEKKKSVDDGLQHTVNALLKAPQPEDPQLN